MMHWLKEILGELLYPRKCMLCRRLLGQGELDLCHSCRQDVPAYPFGLRNPLPKGKSKLHFLDSFTAVWYYENNVRRSLLRFKFYRGTALAAGYGRLLGMKLLEQGPEQFDVLTWVPVSPLRRLFRGYDQSELIARAVGSELGVEPVRLLNKRYRRPQSTMKNAAARKANVLGAFRLAPEAEVSGKEILILDDIFTTGATAEECARVLKTAGAARVDCAAVAAVRYRQK